jgi:hypothetical protein
MAEFGTGAANLTSAFALSNRAVDITFGNQQAAGPLSHGKMLASITKLRLRSNSGFLGRGNGATDTATEGVTVAPYHLLDSMVGNFGEIVYRGPYLVAAGYNDGNDKLIVVLVMTY